MSKKAAVVLICWICLWGCATGLWSSAPTAEFFRRQAADFEINGELQQALSARRAATLLDPGHPEDAEAITVLENAIAEAAQAHFKTGLDHLQAGDPVSARRSILTVLRLSPGHSKALWYLKNHLNGANPQIYKVQRGDSFIKIATDHYKDPGKAYILAYFNDMDPGKPLLTDTLLVLPALRAEQLVQRRSPDIWLERAQRALDQKQYSEVLSLCERVRNESPGHPRIRPMIDAARFGWGRSLLEQGDHQGAMEQLNRVSRGYAGRDQAIRSVRAALQQKGDQAKIKSAQARFDQGAYAGAAAICQDILDNDPVNAHAKLLLQASRYQWGKQLLDKGHDEEAAEKLGMVDPAYKDAAQLLTRAQSRLNTRAEDFYRRGVKFFLNEDLESAIKSWETALKFNPEHPKAAQDMKNAQKLLEKWHSLEKTETADKKKDER
jgi:tetratricopeptide (TPR) repeat protein